MKKFITSPNSSKNKLARLVCKIDYEVFQQAKFLRFKLWSLLLPEIDPFSIYALDLANLLIDGNDSIVAAAELKQIKVDVRRCINFHPLIRLESVQNELVTLLATFLALKKDCAYI